ncbi:MAG TPA: NAD(P)-dependent oxidoreductase [Mesorhizobium sp.]|jgi:UDP-glucose 4-epimerase|nr:NAD(P)-dependent oxidoreductase [Mesorhizobium sp.]
MTLLITGGGGFVMSNLALLWLETHPGERAVVLDSGPLDPPLERFFAPVADRLAYVRASVLDRAALERIAAAHDITRVVHAATVTLFAPESPDGGAVANPETDVPAKVLEVNIMGAVTMLEWARRLPGLKRFINLSSGAVYNDYGPEPAGPMPEEGWVDPPEFYGISKLASEMIGRRYGRLFGMSVAACRLSGVYGPMDRTRPSRAHRCAPYVAIHRALEGKPIRVNAPDAVGDHIHARDVGRAIMALLDKDGPLDHEVYNIAYGEPVTMRQLLEAVADIVPGAQWRTAAPGDCDIVANSAFKGGRWGAYDISRIARETGWRPTPLRAALADYADFIRAFGVTL